MLYLITNISRIEQQKTINDNALLNYIYKRHTNATVRFKITFSSWFLFGSIAFGNFFHELHTRSSPPSIGSQCESLRNIRISVYDRTIELLSSDKQQWYKQHTLKICLTNYIAFSYVMSFDYKIDLGKSKFSAGVVGTLICIYFIIMLLEMMRL